MMERKLGPIPSLALLQYTAYNMSLNDSTSLNATTAGPLRPDLDTYYADLNLPVLPNVDGGTRTNSTSLHNKIKLAA